MKTITTEVLENLVFLAALAQKNTPSLDPLDVSKTLVKMQKIVVTLRGRDSSGIENELTREDYDNLTRGWEKKLELLAATICAFVKKPSGGGVVVQVGDRQQRIF